MSTYRASVRVDDGMLHLSRPLLAPEPVGDLIDSVVFDVTQPERAGVFASIDLVVETAAESDTPIGDSVPATSSQPLDPSVLDPIDGDTDDVPPQSVSAMA